MVVKIININKSIFLKTSLVAANCWHEKSHFTVK